MQNDPSFSLEVGMETLRNNIRSQFDTLNDLRGTLSDHIGSVASDSLDWLYGRTTPFINDINDEQVYAATAAVKLRSRCCVIQIFSVHCNRSTKESIQNSHLSERLPLKLESISGA